MGGKKQPLERPMTLRPLTNITIASLAPLLTCHAKDYGDAPSSYGTRIEENGPSHGVIPTLFMGDLGPDDEPDGLPDIAALGDDLNNLDDEDALIGSPLVFLEGESDKLVVPCTNQTGNLAKLGVWIDWNRDGIFKADEGEFAIADVPSTPEAQEIVVNLPQVPFGVVGGNPAGEISFIRLRLTTDLAALQSPHGSALDGEVEDWQIQIFENYDYGDLPDLGPGTGPGNHRTNLAGGGPRHRLGRPVYLGLGVDGEFNAQPLASALGDDQSGEGDEDGVTARNVIPGLPATFTVTATNETPENALLLAEIDLNQNGSFSDPGERQSRLVLSGSSQSSFEFTFDLPLNLSPGTQLATRFRISTDPLLWANPDLATVHDGEVEDHLFDLTAGLDWGDLPDRSPGTRAGFPDLPWALPDYRTLAADNGPSHVIVPGLAIVNDSGSIDVNIDADLDGQPGLLANGDDEDGNHDDLNLLTALTRQNFVFSPFGADHSHLDLTFVTRQLVENRTGEDTTFYAFFDANRDGDFDDPGEKQTTIVPSSDVPTDVVSEFHATVPWPGLLDWQEKFALRCRLSTDPNLGPNGPAPDGEVQDDIISAQLAISNPRPAIAGPGGVPEPIQLSGSTVTVPLGLAFSPRVHSFLPPEISHPQNPIWSLAAHNRVDAGGVVNFAAEDVNDLGLGVFPMTLSFEDRDTGNLYVVAFI